MTMKKKRRTRLGEAVLSALDSMSSHTSGGTEKVRKHKRMKRPRTEQVREIDSFFDTSTKPSESLFRSVGPQMPMHAPDQVASILEKHGINATSQLVPGLDVKLPRLRPPGSSTPSSSSAYSLSPRKRSPRIPNGSGKHSEKRTVEHTNETKKPHRPLQDNQNETSERPSRRHRPGRAASTSSTNTTDPLATVQDEDDEDNEQDDFFVKALSTMHRETLEEEIDRLTHENTKLASTLAECEIRGRERERRLNELSLLFERSQQFENELVVFAKAQEEKLQELRKVVGRTNEACSLQYFRLKQLQRMYLRTLDSRNICKQTTEALALEARPRGHDSTPEDLRNKIKQIHQECDSLCSEIQSLESSNEQARQQYAQKRFDRTKILSEIQQLRLLQFETAIRRKEIALKTKGDLSKKEENRLRHASVLVEKRRSVVGGVLASITAHVSKYEQLMKKLQQKTGIKEISTVVDRFFSQEHKRIRLDKEVALAIERRDALRSQLEVGNNKLQHLREYGFESSGEVHDFGSLEQRLREARGSMRYKYEKLRQSFRLNINLVGGILPIARNLFIAIPTNLYNPLRIEELASTQYVNQFSKALKVVLQEILSRLLSLLHVLSTQADKEHQVDRLGEIQDGDESDGNDEFGFNIKDDSTQSRKEGVNDAGKTRLNGKGQRAAKSYKSLTVTIEKGLTDAATSPTTKASASSPKSPLLSVQESLRALGEGLLMPNDPNIRVKPRTATPPTKVRSPSKARKGKKKGKHHPDKHKNTHAEDAHSPVDAPLSSEDDESSETESMEELDPSNCLSFLRRGYTDGNEDFVRVSARMSKTKGDDKKQDMIEHNRRLFEIIGRDRFNYINPEAIPADKLYKQYMKENGMKDICLSREEMKVVAKQLVTQDEQSKRMENSTSRGFDFSQRQASFMKMRSMKVSRFDLLSPLGNSSAGAEHDETGTAKRKDSKVRRNRAAASFKVRSSRKSIDGPGRQTLFK